jgi:predicted NBD/HSP70 family sugar kinase
MEAYFAVDIGGTKTLTCLVYENGMINASTMRRFPTAPLPQQAAKEFSANLSKILSNGYEVKAIGVGAPSINNGIFDPIVPNLPQWSRYDLISELEMHKLPVAIENDADAAAAGIFMRYLNLARFGLEDLPFVYVGLGTGVGVGILTSADDGWKIHKGEHGEHLELGHIPMDIKTKGIKCGCKKVNCLESFVGGSGIRNRYLTEPEKASSKVQSLVAQHLALGLRKLSDSYSPKHIALGGGIVDGWGEDFVAEVTDSYAKLSSDEEQATLFVPKINYVGILGAASIAMRI